MRESATQSKSPWPVAFAPGRGPLLLGCLMAMLLVGTALVSGFGVLTSGAKAAIEPTSPRSGPVLQGRADIIDGDTIDINGVRIRLEGIDAPERAQTCPRRWFGTWACGKAAIAKLRSLTAGKPLSCERLGTGRYGRVIAKCSANGQDLAAEMVRTGHAWAFVKYSRTYQDLEGQARRAQVGIWSGRPAQPAWTFRKRRWASAEQLAPSGCAIKGNISSKGKIYHMPWSQWYAKTRISLAHGERWFCSENAAKKAGWRPVGRY